MRMVQVSQDSPEAPKEAVYRSTNNDLSTVNLKIKLEETLRTAKVLAESLKVQILELTARETLLKDAITNGR